MKPLYEHVPREGARACTVLWRELQEIPFVWHYHPEFELTLTLNARGQRYIGADLSCFEPGDLVLIGPDQPHTWSAQARPEPDQPMQVAVTWFTQDWIDRLVEAMPELVMLRELARRAAGALQFSAEVAAAVAPELLALQQCPPADRVPLLIGVLLRLARDEAARARIRTLLRPDSDVSRQRLMRVLDLLHAQWQAPPSMSELAKQAALSVGALHRFFRRHVGCTVGQYTTQLRMSQACRQLIETDRPIRLIAAEVGYASLAQFNLKFRTLHGCTPRELRQRWRVRGAESEDD
ncbi:AraC-type DNA-binding protein [Sphaerotilus natans]|jgi:AraC-like DNA-binding protein|nr:AraC-type DNA-binding protein [Sphaerotilus natans]